jgi:hypothetical protein
MEHRIRNFSQGAAVVNEVNYRKVVKHLLDIRLNALSLRPLHFLPCKKKTRSGAGQSQSHSKATEIAAIDK